MSADALYYYICDECGNIADIAAQPHAPEVLWICDRAVSADDDDDDEKHGESTLSVFRDKDEALAYSTKTMNLHYAAKMARLDQAIARADEMRGKS